MPTSVDAFIFGGTRTPFGRHAGALAGARPDDLLAGAISRLVELYRIPPAEVEDVIAGCANQAGEDSRNVARHAALLAGLPVDVAAITVNRLCGSGLAAVADAARVIACGQADLLIAGGTESMSRAPFVVGKAERPYAREVRMFDSTLGARFPNPRFVGEFGNDSNPQVGDNCAREYAISREASDRFALASQQKYARALAAGFYRDEITTPVVVTSGKTQTTVTSDEPPRPESTLEGLAKLKTVNDGGVVTAGNASSVNDGAAALLLGSRAAGERHGWKPLARIVTAAVCGVPPRLFGIGPIPATRKVLERAGLTLAEMDVIEINEAFASQVLACLKGMGLAEDDARVNPNGGAIAVGHPLGASGARIALTAVRELTRRNGRYGLLTLCIGVGQGIAVIIERVA
jgi:acetyl-CoA C-acetyltransferase